MVAAAWLGTFAFASTQSSAQTNPATDELRVPIRTLQTIQTDQMINFPGYVSSEPSINPLAHYQKSRLGRWQVERDVNPEDAALGVELNTPVGPIRIRYDVTFNGKPFRGQRESTIDDLMKIARGEQRDDDDEDQSNARARMIAYAKSRGEKATRHELRRRVADFARGPALLRTVSDLSSDRKETHILFALFDTNEDGTISKTELKDVGTIFDRCDLNANNRVDLMELHSKLKPRSARRVSQANAALWQAWDVDRSKHVQNLSVKVAFGETEYKSDQQLHDCALADPWKKLPAKMIRLEGQTLCGHAILLTHPKVTIALTASEATNAENSKATGQVSVGVLAEGNALFRHLDRDKNWELNRTEFNACQDRVFQLDQNSDQRVDLGELPILLHVTVARGAVAHQSLQEYVAFLPLSDDADGGRDSLTPPEWFVSMDQDSDRILTRAEFLGDRDAFDKLDLDENQQLSVEESLTSQTK